ncbi:hypothetical protein ISX56_28605, partial [Serratia ureilytica]|nr:hypothetical protein [Serratia ureilytica]
MDLGRLIGTLIDHRWLITGITTIFAVVGLIYVVFATPIYQADALVQVEQNMGSSILNDISKVLPDSQPVSATEHEGGGEGEQTDDPERDAPGEKVGQYPGHQAAAHGTPVVDAHDEQHVRMTWLWRDPAGDERLSPICRVYADING